MKLSNGSSYRRRILFSFVGLIGFLLIGPLEVQAQPVVTPKNLALGGGGTAYLTGIETNFYNPANLMVNDRNGTVHFTLGSAGLFFEPVLSLDQPGEQVESFRDIVSVFQDGSQQINNLQVNALIEENYAGNSLTAQHQTRADFILGGIYWQKADRTFSLAVRSRYASRIEVGRGWYSEEFIPSNEQQIRDFTLVNQTQSLHEISIGYAQEFTYINGLIPRISRLYIGMAPKFIMGGAYKNAVFDARYIREDAQQSPVFASKFEYRSSGVYSKTIEQYRSGNDLQSTINRNLGGNSFFKPTGYGFGFDFGLTYVIPLENNTAILDTGKNRRPVKKSLRFAFSITDLGFISYSSSPFEISSAQDSSSIQAEPTIDSKFVGAPGQYPFIFEKAATIPNPLLKNAASNESISELLPTSINMGTMLDLNRVKINGDLTLGLNNTAFNTTKLTAHIGLEVRPHQKVPLRFGTQVAAGLPVHFGIGTGFESRYWDLLLSTQILVKSGNLTSEVIGGGMVALQFHL